MTTRLHPGRLTLRVVTVAVLIGACAEQQRPRKPPANPTKLQTALAFDKDGNEIMVGTFTHYIVIAGTKLESAGGTDIFVAKLRLDGTLAWAHRYGGPGDDAGTGAAVDAQGNVIVAGTFQGPLALGVQRLDPKFRSADLHALFVAKLDPTGKELWVKQVGVADGPSLVSVAVTPDGKISAGAGIFGRVQKDGGAVSAGGESLLLQNFGPGGEALPTAKLPLVLLDSTQCSHSPCQTGQALVQTCDWCVQTICGLDDYCCHTFWDSICVGEVASDCGQRCDCSQLCTAGNPFNIYACPPCTTNVCSADPYCCRFGWDSTCVSELFTYCGRHCP